MTGWSRPAPGTNLAELLAVLSLGADLGMGQPMEHVQRHVLLAMRIGERLGLDEADLRALFYTGLMAWVGCHIDAYEQAKWFGDDIGLKADYRTVDMTRRNSYTFALRHLTANRGMKETMRIGAAFLRSGRHEMGEMLENHWHAADQLASRIGLDARVRASLYQTFERWDGKGIPEGTAGDDITIVARIVNFTDVIAAFNRAYGTDGAVEVALDRAGTQFDPHIAEMFAQDARQLLSALDGTPTWGDVMKSQPSLVTPIADDDLDDVLLAFADFIDIKSPYTLGHSRAVAELASGAAEQLGLPAADGRLMRQAGLLHDIGRLGVSNSVWDKRASLTTSEIEQVRLHPYLSDRMLSLSPTLSPLATVASQHHERLDGSGYPGGLTGDAITLEGRILAAADMYASKLEPRPHRDAMAASEAAAHVAREVRDGRIDGEAADAVLRSAGHRSSRRSSAPAGLTPREIEVLRLLARGQATKQIGRTLGISSKTAANHIEHIYSKIGVSNRARASLYAVTHGLI